MEESSSPKANRSFVRRLLLSIVAVLVTICLLELFFDALRMANELFSSAPEQTAPLRINRTQPIRYEFNPNTEGSIGPANARINNHGLRGADVDLSQQRIRILCVGDSCTFGFAKGVTDDLTYPAILNDYLKESQGETYEVLNGGMPNFCLLDALNFYLFKGVELKPDYTVIMVGWNDTQHVHGLLMPAKPESVFQWSSLHFGIRTASQKLGVRAGNAGTQTYDGPKDEFSDLAYERYERLLTEFVHVCKRSGSEPVLVTLPNFTQEDWKEMDSLSEDLQRLMKRHTTQWTVTPGGWYQFCKRTNQIIQRVATAEQTPLVAGATVNHPELFVDVCHLNSEGNAKLARLVAAAVLEAENRSSAP